MKIEGRFEDVDHNEVKLSFDFYSDADQPCYILGIDTPHEVVSLAVSKRNLKELRAFLTAAIASMEADE